MSDAWAVFVQRWIVRIVAVVGAGSALAEIAQSLGLNEAAHLALMKVVALAGHIMISILILQCAKPVGELIRRRFAARESLQMLGNALADAWAWFAVCDRDGAVVRLGARRAERLSHAVACRRLYARDPRGRAGRRRS